MLSAKDRLLYLSVQGFAWGVTKGIYSQSTMEAQQEKFTEEVKELQEAIKNNDHGEILDAIGDIYQCYLMMIMIQYGANITDLNDTVISLVESETEKLSVSKIIDYHLIFHQGEEFIVELLINHFGIEYFTTAYERVLNIIKNRKGKMVNGKFEKETGAETH